MFSHYIYLETIFLFFTNFDQIILKKNGKDLTTCQNFRMLFFKSLPFLNQIQLQFLKMELKEHPDADEWVQTSPNPIDILQCQKDLYSI